MSTITPIDEINQRYAGCFADGYTETDITSVLTHLSALTGLDLYCAWEHSDAGGSSNVLADVDGVPHALPASLHALLWGAIPAITELDPVGDPDSDFPPRNQLKAIAHAPRNFTIAPPRTLTISAATHRTLCGLVQPEDVIDASLVVADPPVWAEIRRLFPPSGFTPTEQEEGALGPKFQAAVDDEIPF